MLFYLTLLHFLLTVFFWCEVMALIIILIALAIDTFRMMVK